MKVTKRQEHLWKKGAWFFLFGLVLCSGNILQAQDFKQAMLQMRAAYEQADRLHITMAVQVFEEKSSVQPFYEESVDISRDGIKFLYKFGKNEMLMNDHYLIMVDQHAKEIASSKREPYEESDMKELVTFDMDSILSFYEAPEFLGKENGVSHFRVFQKKGPVRQIDIYLNAETKLLKKMEYKYQEGQFVSIVFQDFNLNPAFPEGTFDENQYVSRINGSLTASGKFRGYKVHDAENPQ